MSGSAPASRVRDRLWRARWPFAVGLVVLTAGVIGALTIPSGTTNALDPRSPTPAGSRAVAQILQAHGVRVTLVQRSTAAVDGAGRRSTIVVVNTSLLGPDQLDRLAAGTADLVLVEPDLVTLDALAPQARPAGVVPADPAPPGCTDPDAVAAGVATSGGRLYRVTAAEPGTSSVACYPAPDGTGFSLLRLTTGDRRVTVIGQSEVLRNGSLAGAGNAALALRVLGARADLRWYLPDPNELIESGGAPTLGELLPPWVRWVGWQLAVALVLALLWRGRRLGRLVTEPLPVVVRSVETSQGRARLYRQAGARDRAAATLRTAMLRRLAGRLGVAGSAPPEDVVRLAAAATGRHEPELHEIMRGGAPADDAALVRLAAALDDVEHQVAGTARAPAAAEPEPDAAPVPEPDPEVGPR